MTITHYEALGVDRSCTEEELTAAWKQRAREFHPDRHVGKTEDELAAMSSCFATCSGAFSVLADRKRRVAYDKELALLRPECGACKGAGRLVKQRGVFGREASVCPSCKGVGRAERRSR